MIVKMSELDSERIVEIHHEDMLEMGLNEGSVVRLKGKRTVNSLAVLAPEGKLKKGEIGVGNQLQARLGVMTGSEISVKKTELPEATRVQYLASTDGAPGESVSFMFKENHQKNDSPDIVLGIGALAHCPIRKGDTFTLTSLGIDGLDGLSSTNTMAPEMQRLVMQKTVYIKIVETFPVGEVMCGKDTEWCEADLKQILHGQKEISFDMIGGLKGPKDLLRQAVEGPIKHAGHYKRLNIRPTKGILLFGPPGVGKTMLAKAVAKDLEAELVYIKGAEVYTPYFGASEQLVRDIFKYARTFGRAVIFWDEFDAVGTARGTAGNNSRLFDTILNSLLVEMDGLSNNENIIVIAATNRMDQLDPALLRPGRFDFVVRVPLPDQEGRKEIIAGYLKGKPGEEKMDASAIAKRTVGYTGADIENLVRVACLEVVENCKEDLTMAELESALTKVRPSLTKEQVEYYEHMINDKGNPSSGKKLPMYG